MQHTNLYDDGAVRMSALQTIAPTQLAITQYHLHQKKLATVTVVW